MSAGEDTANIGNCCRPDRVVGVDTALDNPTVSQVVQHCRISRAAQGTFGTAGRGEVIGPGIFTFDFSMSKEIHFGASPYIQFRVEAFNFLNHPNWGEPNTTFQSVAFGTINTTRTDMRQISSG